MLPTKHSLRQTSGPIRIRQQRARSRLRQLLVVRPAGENRLLEAMKEARSEQNGDPHIEQKLPRTGGLHEKTRQAVQYDEVEEIRRIRDLSEIRENGFHPSPSKKGIERDKKRQRRHSEPRRHERIDLPEPDRIARQDLEVNVNQKRGHPRQQQK